MADRSNGIRMDRWATRFGLVMAMAGNAVGLGNFLRFPGKAAPYGGAFLVPYLISFVLLGIPLMWMEWTIGRHGGRYGHGSTPGMFHRLWKHPVSKYLGIFGVLLPFIIALYYIYIESWALGYAWKTATGSYWGQTSRTQMSEVFTTYLGIGEGVLSFSPAAYMFFLITFAANIFVFSRGIEKGIEVLSKYAMPALVLLGIVLAARVLTLQGSGEQTVSRGLAQIWVIDWSMLKNPAMWMDATGQIFLTLSVGLGMLHTYASILRDEDDLTLNGLAACATNEFVEVILGGTIIIPAAAVFFGVGEFGEIIHKGSFADMGFQTLPVIFQEMWGGRFFGTIWFILLFLAGLTSSVAMFTPMLLFLRDELNLDHNRLVLWITAVAFILCQPVILFFHHGVLDELDDWAGTFFLVVFAAIEVVVFIWIYGLDKGWVEMHLGADLRIPKPFCHVMRFLTPLFLLALLAWFTVISPLANMHNEDALANTFYGKLFMMKIAEADVPYHWLGRAIILGVAAFLVWGVWQAWRTHPKFFDDSKNGKAE